MPSAHRTTRRQFLALAGLSTAAAGLACAGSIAGYLLLRAAGQTSRSRPTLTPTRSPALKTIDRPAITTRAEWGAREPDHTAWNEPGYYAPDNPEGWREYSGDLRTSYRTVVVHHSVEYDGDDLSTVRHIQDLHMDDRGWADIAYHFLVGKTGQVFEGRALNARGTHVEYYNTGSVGVVFLGDFEVEQPTAPQLEQGRRLIDWLALRLELTHLAGHFEFNETTACPGPNLIPYLDGLAYSARLARGTGGYEPPPE